MSKIWKYRGALEADEKKKSKKYKGWWKIMERKTYKIKIRKMLTEQEKLIEKNRKWVSSPNSWSVSCWKSERVMRDQGSGDTRI